MKARTLIFGAIALIFSVISCVTAPSKSADGHNSQNSLNWEGVYAGVVPCASCPGIQTIITINQDNTFTKVTTYLESEAVADTVSGTFAWDENGSVITLNGIEGSNKFKVGENKLFMLDLEGNIIEGNLADNYILTKASDLVEKTWKLTMVNGVEVTNQIEGNEAHIFFQVTEDRFYGSTGCNRFFGGYELNDQNQIIFSGVGSTRMMCEDMTVEDNFLKLLNGTVDYALDVDTLQFKDAEGNAVASFVAVAQ